MDPIRTELDIDHLRQAATAYATLNAWAEVGTLAALADGEPRAAAELPGDTRAIEITAPVLAHLGLLMRVGEKWALTGTGQRLYEGGILDLPGSEGALGAVSRMGEILASGGPARRADGTSLVSEGGVREHDPAAARAFMDYLHRRAGDEVDEVVRWVSPRLRGGARVLDLGGGHGRYAYALSNDGLQATVFDRPVCVEVARERYGHLLDYIEGDFLTDPLGGPWDAVLLSNIIHGLGPQENRDLLTRLKAALRPGGMVMVNDLFIADNWTSPAGAVLFGLTMLMFTREGQTYRAVDFAALCREAGFTTVEEHHQADRGHSLLFIS